MLTRTIQIGMCTYIDPNGVRRIGQQGEQVNVHADDVKRFDAINGGPRGRDSDPEAKTAARAPQPKPAPKKRGRPRKA